MKKAVERVTGIAAYNLPASLSREIGRIIVHWAHFEHLVQDMVWQTMQVTHQVGRIAVRTPRVTDRLEMLRELVKLRNGEWNDALFKSILDRANIFAARRDLLAHGIWGAHSNPPWEGKVWHVELARGSWPKNLKDLIAGSKKINPEMVPIRASELKSTTNEIVQLIADLKELALSAVS